VDNPTTLDAASKCRHRRVAPACVPNPTSAQASMLSIAPAEPREADGVCIYIARTSCATSGRQRTTCTIQSTPWSETLTVPECGGQ
jgi:hypothetical protein